MVGIFLKVNFLRAPKLTFFIYYLLCPIFYKLNTSNVVMSTKHDFHIKHVSNGVENEEPIQPR